MKLRIAVAAFTAVFAIASCGSDTKPKETPKKAAVKESSSTSEVKVPAGPTFALRGTPDAENLGPTRAVISVKIPNNPELRGGAQKGLLEADVVYEEVVEGQATRFLAMYHSNLLDRVGPVRSVRLIDPDIVWPVQGVFAYSGGAAYIVPRIKEAPVVSVDESAGQSNKALYRDRSVSRTTEFTLFADLNVLTTLGGQPTPPPALFEYRTEAEPSSGDPVLAANVGFAQGFSPTWKWNATSGVFERLYGDSPHKSGENAITASNVVVQFIRYDGGLGREGSKGVMIGEGDAWVLSDGKLIKGSWKRDTRESVTKFADATGAPIKLTPGNTWVELADLSYSVGVFPGTPIASESSSSSRATSTRP